jgi:hypothetical protein
MTETINMTITTQVLSADENNAFRRAFAQITRAAMPFMDPDTPYLSDLLYDAALAAKMNLDERMYIVVREHGTTAKVEPLTAASMCTGADAWRAVLRVIRQPFDSFYVDVVYVRDEGFTESATCHV